MIPTEEDYRKYGEKLGKQIGPVDWYGFSQMKRYDHGILPKLRAIAGYEDMSNKGTYTRPRDDTNIWILEALVDGFRYGATQEGQE